MDSYNERIKLLATALNNLGVSAIIAGIIAPMVRGEVGGVLPFVIWFAVGFAFIGGAWAVLGRTR
jgi:hypothetical protein